MSDIDELQRRILAAMDRVTSGVNAMSAGGSEAQAALESALEDERVANAQLTERVRKLSAQQDSAIAEAKSTAQTAQSRTVELDLEVQRLRKANVQLRDAIDALRAANEKGVGEPHLINKAMMAELEALRAERATEMAEASRIIGALTPLLDQAEAESGEAANA